MKPVHRIWARFMRKWSVEPDQADLLAKIKFPCC